MKYLETVRVIIIICILSESLIPIPTESASAEEKAAQEEMYEAYGRLCFGGKGILKAIDFLSLPKDDVKALVPINWAMQLENYGVILTPVDNYGRMGSKYSWKHGDFEGIANVATYASTTEAQLGLADALGHLPVKLDKGAFEGLYIGDACFHGNSNIYFVRKNFLVHVRVHEKDKSQQTLSALNHLAETIDKIILASTVLLKEAAPFQVTISKEWFNINEKVDLITVPQKNDRPFIVYSEQIKGTSKIEGQLWTPKLKPNETQTCTFEARESGDGTLKVYVCEESGMVWTYYIQFNVFR